MAIWLNSIGCKWIQGWALGGVAALFASICAHAIAQAKPTAVPQNIDPPTEIKAAAQASLVHQDWYCRAPNTRSDVFATGVRRRLSELGANGWEVVGFSHAPIAGQECFVATLKAPKK